MCEMFYYNNPGTDPCFNMALEEYLMKTYPSCEDVVMLWQSGPAVLIGRHQNTLAQINREYVERSGIEIVRRITGGGSVYQDLGNVNYSCILRNAKDARYNFKMLAEPVISALCALGVNAEFSSRNDISVNGAKISGNAQHIYHDTVLHHGTLLLNSDLDALGRALTVKKSKLAGKGIDSVRSRVANLSEFLAKPLSMDEFKQIIMKGLLQNAPDAHPLELTAHDLEQVENLADTKFRTWSWNYGESPDYNLYREKQLACGEVELYLKLDGEKIESIRFFGDFLGGEDVSPLEKRLTGTQFSAAALQKLLEEADAPRYFADTGVSAIMELFFPNQSGGENHGTAQA
jgi:lipoate-protein ligase A